MAQRNVKQARTGMSGDGDGEQHAGVATGAHVSHRAEIPQYETVALMLQGGGALGAYQAGVYQGLDEAGIRPNWLAGISIGALNTAIIAGNAPEHRVARLLEFWETICQPAFGPPLPPFVEQALFSSTDSVRKAFTAMQAMGAIVDGQKGFFVPRFPPPLPTVSGPPQLASYYDTSPLKATLERLCDFDRINSGDTRVSVGAVNVGTGISLTSTIRTRVRHCGRSTSWRPAHCRRVSALSRSTASITGTAD